ncbi:MAG: (2Fe-2S)-binding protein [Clostridium sp.]|uniref:(2Fe-2S)-binding protein n=1 Tax=Clostridium sp. TaxID=1506 RepID=UPI002FC9A4B6
MDNKLQEEVIDKLTKTCVCSVVTRHAIKTAIKDGARTFEDVKKATRAGGGNCKGARCKYKIEELIASYRDK